MTKEKKLSSHRLTVRILIGMVAGLIFGVVINAISPAEWIEIYVTGGLLHIGGSIFLASLKLLVVPLVLVSLICGAGALEDVKKIGRIGGRMMCYYMCTTATAIALALLLALLIQPGSDFHLDTTASFTAPETPSFVQTVIDIFPTNPVKAMAEGNMLQIIVFAILFGITLPMVGEAGKRLLAIFNDLNEVVMKMVMLLMEFAPYGIFFMIAKVFAGQGFSALLPMLKYFLVVVAALLLHEFLVFGLILKFIVRLNPAIFYKKFRGVLAVAFSTSSSGATLPITLETVEHDLGVPNSIASFAIPLGATINMDGTAIMQGVASVFIAQAYGIDLSLTSYLLIIVTATLASIGTAGVPGVGIITLAMVLRQVGLPVEGIGLIIGVDRLLDMLRTAVNVTGDAVGACYVARAEKQFDLNIYNNEKI
ncbi:MAG: dicarboxylate/amino acid:cation symporter [Bdellovibrionales bacterium]|nr:dicarboxylate/amino acid:cation symporter [Bdellovibrionales bacterium]